MADAVRTLLGFGANACQYSRSSHSQFPLLHLVVAGPPPPLTPGLLEVVKVKGGSESESSLCCLDFLRVLSCSSERGLKCGQDSVARMISSKVAKGEANKQTGIWSWGFLLLGFLSAQERSGRRRNSWLCCCLCVRCWRWQVGLYSRRS